MYGMSNKGLGKAPVMVGEDRGGGRGAGQVIQHHFGRVSDPSRQDSRLEADKLAVTSEPTRTTCTKPTYAQVPDASCPSYPNNEHAYGG